MTDDAIAELTPVLGSVRAACKAAGRPQANHYRRHRQSPKPDKPKRERKAQPRALTPAERDTVRAVLNSPTFVDMAPASVYHELLDEGVHLCSPSTMYRILHAHNEVKERRRQAVHPARVKPELVATKPNQCWSWDITKLHGPAKWTYYYLYVIIDIYSRYVVGWLLADAESKVLAEKLLADTIAKQNIDRNQLTIHADNGSSMASKPVAFLLADLGVTKSHSRPHTSNDNPFSESQFRTLKYRPDFPDTFGSIADARAFCQRFFTWSGYAGDLGCCPACRGRARVTFLVECVHGLRSVSGSVTGRRWWRGCQGRASAAGCVPGVGRGSVAAEHRVSVRV